MSRYFNDLITTKFYNRSKQTAKGFIQRTLGERAVHICHRIEASLKGLILSEETIFEKMGIRYIGPVDGHDLPRLIAALTHVRDLKGPILLHVKTVKGKGYTYSESDPERWHSGANFEVSTGEKVPPVNAAVPNVPAQRTFTQVFSEAITRLGEEDARVVALPAAMSTGTGLDDFAQKFPSRFHDVGIAEGHAVTCAAGMACEGLRPWWPSIRPSCSVRSTTSSTMWRCRNCPLRLRWTGRGSWETTVRRTTAFSTCRTCA